MSCGDTILHVAVRQAAVELVGERIRKARKDKRWLQKDLARSVHVEPTTISRWERGATSPDIYMLERVAEVTGKPLSFFVTGASPAPAGEALPSDPQAELEALHALVQKQMVLLERFVETTGAALEELLLIARAQQAAAPPARTQRRRQ